MAQKILLTSLSAMESDLPLRYYSVQNGSGLAYADVLLDAEAGIKTVLSRYEIDEVIIIGSAGSYDEGDIYSPESTFGLLQKRIAQFKEGAMQEEDENLPEDIREKPDAYSRLAILPANKDVNIMLIPESEFEDGEQWVNNLMEMGKTITEDAEDVELYVTLNSDDAADTFIVLNMLDILISMPQSGVKLEKIFTVRRPQKRKSGIVRDDTEGFGVTELFHAIRAFTNYGRADMIVDIWKKSGESNESIESMVYAMRDVDVGLSMCNMTEVERGILRLRELFRSEQFWRESGYYGALFSLIAESIREDYGVLMEGEGDLNFIELVKWAYRHQFYQQTLTLIEAKTPENLVNSGIFYYCDDEEHRDQVMRLLAEQRLRLRSYEFYKMDSIEHYFIKSYNRYKERGACVYVLDADSTDNTYPPGFWLDGYDLNLIEKICDSGWRLEIMQFDKNGYVAGDYKRIYSPDGEVIGYVEMDLELTEFAKRINRFLMILIPSIIFLVLIIAMLLSRMLKNFVITHLTELADAAKEYTARDNTAIEEDTPSVFEPLAINTADEIEDLWLSMTGMETDVKESMLKLREMTSEKERMLAELDIAKEIQMGTLPAEYPERCEFGLYASIQPAKSVGGDLYDFFMVDDDHLVMVIADVSGKGVSAALFMVIAKTLIQNQTELGGQDPAEVFYAVNTKLMRINKAHMFVTAWLGILTISTGELIYVNAGHEYPAVRRSGELFEVIKDVHGVPLAASKRAKFESGTFMLYPGDTIYVYTDGVPEANNEAGEMLGRDRMLEALNREADADPETIDRNVHEAIADFVGGADQFDDTTMLCLKYRGHEEQHQPGNRISDE